MTEYTSMGDDAILEELGQRLRQRRITKGLTQAALAREAGVSKRTVERIEAGAATQTLNFVRLLRVLDLLGRIDQLVPEVGPSPMDLLKRKGKARQRATSHRTAAPPRENWSWEDDA